MKRLDHLERFYEILAEIENRLDGKKFLANLEGSHLPQKGVYFFFEKGEVRSDSGQGMRVVRVGTHALKKGSKSTLWQRLRSHRGFLKGQFPGGGNHRGSIFRLHLGTALMKKHHIHTTTWGVGSSASHEVRMSEHPLELLVSETIRAMPFLYLKVLDKPGPESTRRSLEKNAVALLSNYQKPGLDIPSQNWLENHCTANRVKLSGLWNSDHVDEDYDPAFLDTIKYLAKNL